MVKHAREPRGMLGRNGSKRGWPGCVDRAFDCRVHPLTSHALGRIGARRIPLPAVGASLAFGRKVHIGGACVHVIGRRESRKGGERHGQGRPHPRSSARVRASRDRHGRRHRHPLHGRGPVKRPPPRSGGRPSRCSPKGRNPGPPVRQVLRRGDDAPAGTTAPGREPVQPCLQQL